MKRMRTFRLLGTILAAILAVVVLFPFYLVLVNSCKNANDIVSNPINFMTASFSQLQVNLNAVMNNSNFNFWYAFSSSVIITVVSLALLVLLGAMAAWVICRNKTKWSTAIYMTFIASMIIPFQVVMLPLISTFRDAGNFLGISMLQSYPGIVFAYLGFGGAMTVFILTGFIKGIPYELEEAASIDGCTTFGAYWRVVVPLIKPMTMTILVLNVLWVWNDFQMPLIILNQDSSTWTLPLFQYNFKSQYTYDYNMAFASYLIAMVPVMIAYICAQKYIVAGLTQGAVKS